MASLDSAKKQKWIDTVESLDMRKNSREAWAVFRRLEGKRAASQQPKIKAQAVAGVLTENSQIKIDKRHNKIIRSQLHHILSKTHQPHNISSVCFSSSEVCNAIKELKAGKAPGKDGIHPEFLRNLGQKTHLWIAEVFHAIYKSGRVPKSWKTANGIALLKPGKPADNPTCYRPISLLSVLSKLMERIILRRISPLIEPAIPPYQAGFRPNRGCCNQVLSLTSHLEKGFNDKLKSGAAFIDLFAAYDTVWKKGLLWKTDKIIPCPVLLRYIETILNR